MDAHQKLLLANKAWIKERLAIRPDYFERMRRSQEPEFLWIGCSDSRVPAEEVTGTEPGELFVHRNVANLVIHTDFNLLSVLQYAVEVLKVKHVIVCGHYDCGGIKNAMTRRHLGLINKWLRHIKDIYRLHKTELEAIADLDKRARRLVELNVIEQVHHLADTSIIQNAWKHEQRPLIHGWVYEPGEGQLQTLTQMKPGDSTEEIYMYDFDS